jgi:hypothetical protein
MARWFIVLGVLVCLAGAAIIAYGVWQAFAPPATCQGNGTGCGKPQVLSQ